MTEDICPYCNIIALCRYFLNEDGNVNEKYKAKFCDSDFKKCERYRENEVLKLELIKQHGTVKGLEKAINEINTKAHTRDRLDGVLR